MTARIDTAWRSEFGITDDRSGSFFASADDLRERAMVAPHAHVLRRAFGLLELDGVLCDQGAPIAYFKQMAKIQPTDVLDLHRRFWNHGGAPILVLISPSEVQVYSGFSRPTRQADLTGLPSLVERIRRASSALREFLPSVKSGEFFRRHSKSFNPAERVDRALLDNLQATRDKLAAVGSRRASSDILDAFLCRLVFTCYLFDREVIGSGYLKGVGLPELPHLRDVLGIKPRSEAKAALYKLFAQLARDFNGDLFSDNLDNEAAVVTVGHLDVVEEFFRATDVKSGQGAFWPYDFGVIPIETISAIYERFLKETDKEAGAFYTPRFLAELVLDVALADRASVLGLRCLDPACGSGIFLVGLFNRMAEEWRRANPSARNDRRARELKELLRSRIFGVDVSRTACRITAFSLYLAYLDQLAPRDIQELQAKEPGFLPRLVAYVDQPSSDANTGTIWCGDFFREGAPYPTDVDLAIGNPPWGSKAVEDSPAKEWCDRRQLVVPDKQIAAAFVWKAAVHVSDAGRICLVLPHGVLFNHSGPAITFQKALVRQHALDRVLNLTDYQSFLFREARHPALILSYRRQKPARGHTADYWVPKTDWKVKKAEIITVAEQDRVSIRLEDILRDLEGEDAPQIWKRMSWATSRDRRLLDRLVALPRLRDRVRQSRENGGRKPWLIAEGFQPFGPNDDPDEAVMLDLPSDLFIKATSPLLQLFLLQDDCTKRAKRVKVRGRSNKTVEVFQAPHVLVAHGFRSIAFADFAVSFQHALRGITGSAADRKLLIFLAAYLRSSLAQYFLFHTSSNWGVSRQKVHVEELLRLPFVTPDATCDPSRAKKVVDEVARLVQTAMRDAQKPLSDRESVIETTQAAIEPLVYEYFDVLPVERVLIEDTVRLSIPSFRPGPKRRSVPAIEPSKPDERVQYTKRLCGTLNGWARGSQSRVVGAPIVSEAVGVGLVVLEKVDRAKSGAPVNGNGDLLAALDGLREAASLKLNTFELARGVKVFDGNRLFVVKPLERRYWTETAALNDADEIAGSILMQAPGATA